jgi:hypothetical protein
MSNVFNFNIESQIYYASLFNIACSENLNTFLKGLNLNVFTKKRQHIAGVFILSNLSL